MEPRQFSQEQAPRGPSPYEGLAQVGDIAPQSVEARPGQDHERQQRPIDLNEANSQVSNAMPGSLPAPVVTSVAQDDDSASTPADDNPIIAGDEDLIEKEWVDRAKQIISATRDDPYKREQEIKKLQLDYVKKRYGREIGTAGD